jgi:hypothetical protein
VRADLIARPQESRQVAEHTAEQRLWFTPEAEVEQIAMIIEDATLRGAARSDRKAAVR